MSLASTRQVYAGCTLPDSNYCSECHIVDGICHEHENGLTHDDAPSESSSGKGSVPIELVIGGVLGSVALVLVLLCTALFCKRRAAKVRPTKESGQPLEVITTPTEAAQMGPTEAAQLEGEGCESNWAVANLKFDSTSSNAPWPTIRGDSRSSLFQCTHTLESMRALSDEASKQPIQSPNVTWRFGGRFLPLTTVGMHLLKSGCCMYGFSSVGKCVASVLIFVVFGWIFVGTGVLCLGLAIIFEMPLVLVTALFLRRPAWDDGGLYKRCRAHKNLSRSSSTTSPSVLNITADIDNRWIPVALFRPAADERLAHFLKHGGLFQVVPSSAEPGSADLNSPASGAQCDSEGRCDRRCCRSPIALCDSESDERLAHFLKHGGLFQVVPSAAEPGTA
eukprot:CAMPEP_0175906096 /NCGR_PEP_ID=MMETSP0108-20121206/5368_1 /TAXON_ID=195067 ORGANISM="Goniomonas pacifica, Strain CCMP1869" /NCGR_SAMPLE_ID=MMETSP0108 /ASSEMBLY_ACC=CAM_ASM_000204 /LENGTH=391 /DNA_ID=CAMNT_0017228033 /DNA_START=51 /DNA_END=1224 /DNA_ORIENTATION=+